MNVTQLPPEILSRILSFLSYDEVANQGRLTSKQFNQLSTQTLNLGFAAISKQHAGFLQDLLEKLPRRHSKRDSHKLYPHYNTLRLLKTRITLLDATFGPSVHPNNCFVPGKILDELNSIMRNIKKDVDSNRPLSFAGYSSALKELRDLVLMSVDYFKEKIHPAPDSKQYRYSGRASASPKYHTCSDTQQKSSEDLISRIEGLERTVIKQDKSVRQQDGRIANLMKTISYQYKRIADQSIRINALKAQVAEQNIKINSFAKHSYNPRVLLSRCDNPLEKTEVINRADKIECSSVEKTEMSNRDVENSMESSPVIVEFSPVKFEKNISAENNEKPEEEVKETKRKNVSEPRKSRKRRKLKKEEKIVEEKIETKELVKEVEEGTGMKDQKEEPIQKLVLKLSKKGSNKVVKVSRKPEKKECSLVKSPSLKISPTKTKLSEMNTEISGPETLSNNIPEPSSNEGQRRSGRSGKQAFPWAQLF